MNVNIWDLNDAAEPLKFVHQQHTEFVIGEQLISLLLLSMSFVAVQSHVQESRYQLRYGSQKQQVQPRHTLDPESLKQACTFPAGRKRTQRMTNNCPRLVESCMDTKSSPFAHPIVILAIHI